jgi:MFS family permease
VAVLAGALIGWSGLIFFDVAWETAIQDQVPHQALGRVTSWDILMSFLAMPLGNALAGPLSGAFGVNPVVAAAAAVLLLAGLSQMLIPGVRRLTRASPELAATATAAQPEPTAAI